MKIDFAKSNGLVPVVTQEYGTKDVLMLAYMNEEAFTLTVETKIAHYYSRSKSRIWKKGESSGHIQHVMDLQIDCDNDTILLIVEQDGNSACHTGAKSCFFRSYFYDDTTLQVPIQNSKTAKLPTKYANFTIKAYRDEKQEHLAIMSENFAELDSPALRIHSECLTGDTMKSLKCDCNNQLQLALEYIAKHGGIVIYHRQEGRNIGLVNKINAYHLQDQGLNTIEANEALGFKADERDYRVVGHILKDLGIDKLKLITNNPTKIAYVESQGVTITERITAITPSNLYNEGYLHVKQHEMGHML